MKVHRLDAFTARLRSVGLASAALLLAACGGGGGGGGEEAAITDDEDRETASGSSRSCAHRVNNSASKLLECVRLDRVRAHQAAFQAIANLKGGNRAAGTRGYDWSVAYVAARMRHAGYRVTLHPFQFDYVPLPTLRQTAPTAATYEASSITGTGYGSAAAAVTAVDINLAPPRATTSGCEAADFAAFPAGHIALVQRGTCSFAIKALNAQAAGAVAVIIFNQGNAPDREDVLTNATLAPDVANIPVIGASFASGVALAQPGAQASITLVPPSNVTQYNVIAESRSGDPNNVVMVGAHLDSVQRGPGINDNGSGSAAILETALQMANVKPRNKLRFAWWGGEEAGLIGSTAYVTGLSATDQARIALYLNFDMVGSPNHVFFIYDGDDSDGVGAPPGPAGSAQIEQVFERFYTERGIPFKGTDFTGRSDYGPFIAAGVDIPAGGLFTGAEELKTAEEAAVFGGTAGVAYDACYHLPCDTYSNVNRKALDINSDAIAYATLHFAMNTGPVKAQRGRANFARAALQWPEHPPVDH